jgi:putative SOS response-associated peptidase YedK
MCARYDLHHSVDVLLAVLKSLRGMSVDDSDSRFNGESHAPGDTTSPAVKPNYSNYNVAPTNEVPVVVARDGRWVMETMQLGLVPSFIRELRECVRPVNARADGVLVRPYFRDAIRKRRCLVPMSGYYEWQKAGKQRLPYYIYRKDGKPFYVAGIWEEWRSPAGPLRTVATLTVGPNDLIASIPHDRMLAILEGETARAWMDPRTRAEDAVGLLRPDSSEAFTLHRVSVRVNRVAENGPTCIEPVGEADAVYTGELNLFHPGS